MSNQKMTEKFEGLEGNIRRGGSRAAPTNALYSAQRVLFAPANSVVSGANRVYFACDGANAPQRNNQVRSPTGRNNREN
ncbi:MAG: hypothetical protein WA109_12760 [Bellilinea sp.]